MRPGTSSSDQLERILRLLAFLLASTRPRSREEIFEALSKDYSGGDDAKERKLHRDREALRSLGIEVRYDQDDDEEWGYRLDRSAFYLTDVGLSPNETAALCAVGSVAANGAFPMRSEIQNAVAKLLATGRTRRSSSVLTLPGAPLDSATAQRADVAARAARERRRLRIIYGAESVERIFEPWVFTARQGRFAVVGHCHLRGDVRTFYVDRMVECAFENATGSGEFDVPADFDPSVHLPQHSWQVRLHDPVEVTLVFSGDLQEAGPRTLGIDGDRCVTTNVDGLIAQVVALGPGVEIVGPPEVRARLRDRLTLFRNSLRRPIASLDTGAMDAESSFSAEEEK